MNNFRWNPYVLLEGDELDICFNQHFTTASKVLIIMSKGFDVRMNIALNKLKSIPNGPQITCLLISFDEGTDSASHAYSQMVQNNMTELESLIDRSNVINVNIQLWLKDGQSKRRVGDRKAAELIDDIDINSYSDILVDISALPRGIYFSMIGKLLAVIDDITEQKKPNLMVIVAENPELDAAIKDDTPDEDLTFLHGFSGESIVPLLHRVSQ